MRKILSLLLALTFALSACAGFAEETASAAVAGSEESTAAAPTAEDAYLPGMITARYLKGALETGRHLGASVSLVFVPDEGLTGDEELQAKLVALSDVLNNSALNLGYAATEEGRRFELGGYVLSDEQEMFYTDFAVTVNRDGLILESDLLEGRRYSVQWETLLAAAGMDEEQIGEVIAGIRRAAEFDPDYFLNEELPAFAEKVAAKAAPYAMAAVQWASTLPVETVDGVEGNDFIPKVDGMLQIRITEADLVRLAEALLDQLDADESLRPYLDRVLAAASDLPEGVTDTASLTAKIREALASAQTSDVPLVITFGSDEENVVFCVDTQDADVSHAFNFTVVAALSEPIQVALRCSGIDGESFSFACDTNISLNPEAAEDGFQPAAAIEGEYDLAVNDVTVMSGIFSEDVGSFSAESGEPGWRTTSANTVSITEPKMTQNVEQSQEWVRTEVGGESFTSHATGDTTVEDVHVSVIGDSSFLLTPAENGLFDAWLRAVASLPEQNIAQVGLEAMIYGDEYESFSDYMETVPLDEMDGEAMSALMDELMANARTKRTDLLAALPEELRSAVSLIVGGTYEPDDPQDDVQQGYVDGFMDGYGIGYEDGYKAALDSLLGDQDAEPEAPAPAEDSSTPALPSID